MKYHFLESELQTRGDVRLPICQLGLRLAWGAEGAGVFAGKNGPGLRRTIFPTHLDTGRRMPKVIEVQTKLALRLERNNLSELIDEAWLTVGRQPHHFALIAIMGKTQKLGRGRVNDSQRVRILNLSQDPNRVPFADRPHGRDEISK